MKGLIFINSFINSPNFSKLYSSLEYAFFKQNIKLELKGNADLLVELGANNINKKKYDFILFWDKDILLARHLENLGHTLYNSSSAIEIADDKGHTAVVLEKADIPMPHTILAPLTYSAVGYNNLKFTDQISESLGFPFVLKKNKSSFGQDVHLVGNKQELAKLLVLYAGENLLFQEYIHSARDIRIYVVGGEAVACAQRLPQEGDFRANFALGGDMLGYQPTKEEKSLAIRAARELGLSFAGVDILAPQNDAPMVLEVNSNAHFAGLSKVADRDIATDIANFIIGETKNGKIYP